MISFGIEGFQVVAQPVEAVLPLDPPGVDPPFSLAERLRFDGAGTDPADLFRAHQACRLQDAEVLHRGRQRHRERPGQLAHRSRSTAQPFYHGSAPWVGEGVEQAVQIGRLVKHILNYHAWNS